jgi:hypothetical protein
LWREHGYQNAPVAGDFRDIAAALRQFLQYVGELLIARRK